MRKYGSEIEVGDLINVGIKKRVGRVLRIEDHPRFSELNGGLAARVAVTDVGRITIADSQQIEVFQSA